jgi:hypothetical protein
MKQSIILLVTFTILLGIPEGIVLSQAGDTDGDGVSDSVDNCAYAFNAHQVDTDGDGIGDVCDSRTLYGRFAEYLTGNDEDRQLKKGDGSLILPGEVEQVYGTPDGMTIYDNGIDVATWEYAAYKGYPASLRPVYQDLSDAAGWPNVHVTPGTVAIDPGLGRFSFAGGDADPLRLVGSEWTGFGVPGSGFVEIDGNTAYIPAGEGEFQAIDITDEAHPRVIGHATPPTGFNGSVTVFRHYAYVDHRGATGLSAFDISDPTNPQLVGQGIWPARPRGIAIRDDGVGVITNGSEPGLTVVDFASNPLNPVEIASVNVGDPSGAGWVSLSGDRAVVQLRSAGGLLSTPPHAYAPKIGGFAVIDISDPASPVRLSVFTGEPGPPTLQSSLQAYYPFDGDTLDASGNGRDAIAYGPTPASGYEGGAFSFDGVDDYVWAPVNINPSKHPQLTMGAWVNAATIPAYNDWGGILSSRWGWWDRTLSLDHRWTGSLAHWAAFTGSGVFGGEPATAEEWVFLATVYDNDAVTLALYVDDKVYTTSASAGDGFDTMYIGAANNALGQAINHFHGLVDNAFIFGAALDPDEIDTIRTGGRAGIESVASSSLIIPPPADDFAYTAPKLIGVSGDIAVMARPWIPPNYYHPQAAELVLVDISDPSNPVQRGSYAFTSNLVPESRVDLFNAVGTGCSLYVSDTSYDSTQDSLNAGIEEDYTSLLTFDIRDPDQPVLVDRHDHPQPSRFRHLTMEGTFLYVNDYNYGVRVFDLSNPTQPALHGGTVTAAEGRYAWVNDAGTTAYAAQTFGGTIYSFDISDPANPAKLGVYWDGEWNEKSKFTGRGDYLYVPTFAGLQVIDATDPANPVRVGSFPGVFLKKALHLWGDVAYVLAAPAESAISTHLYTFDIADPANPIARGSLDLGAWHERVFSDGRYAYVSGDQTFKVVDVSDPTIPLLIGQLDDPALDLNVGVDEAGRLSVANGYAYVLTGERSANYLHILDVSDPLNPAFVTTFTGPPTHITDLIVSGKYLYLGNYGPGLQVYDLSNPVDPQLVEVLSSTPGVSWPLAWSIGRLSGEHIVMPSLSDLMLVDVPRDGQGLIGPISVHANINQPPSANAGGPYAGTEGTPIPLNEATASDADGDTLTYSWTSHSASCTFSNPGLLRPELTCDDDGSYVVTLTVDDDVDDPVSSGASVTVNNVAPSIDAITAPVDPVNVNDQPVSVEVAFTDPGTADTQDVTWDWGDIGSDTQYGATSPASQDHSYTEAGVYTVQVTLTDDDGGSATEIHEFIVIYDPEGGFVTGGGWIASPAGACQLDSFADSTTGKANFGFVSKYKKGASVPTGNTEFQFNAADLKFHSTSYDWLVVTGSDYARFKGTGTINGAGEYRFMLWAGDGAGPSGEDTFRIKIWWEEGEAEHVVYDNGIDQAIGGGNVVVHHK